MRLEWQLESGTGGQARLFAGADTTGRPRLKPAVGWMSCQNLTTANGVPAYVFSTALNAAVAVYMNSTTHHCKRCARVLLLHKRQVGQDVHAVDAAGWLGRRYE